MPKGQSLKTPGAKNTEVDEAPQRLTAGSLKRLSLPTPLQPEGGASRRVVKADADADEKSDGDGSGHSSATSVHEDLISQSMRREDGPGVLERSLTAAEQRNLLLRNSSLSASASAMEGTDSYGPRNTLLFTRQKDGGLLNDCGEVDLEGHVNEHSPARRLSMPPNSKLDIGALKDGEIADTSFLSNSTTFLNVDESFPMESFQTGDGHMASSSAANIQRFTPGRPGASKNEGESSGLFSKLGRLMRRKSSLLETHIADGGYLDDSGEVDLLSARGRGSSVATSYTNDLPCHPASMTSAQSEYFDPGLALEAGAFDASLMLSADAMDSSAPAKPSAVSSQNNAEKKEKKKKEPKAKKEKKEMTLEEVRKMLDEDSTSQPTKEPKVKKEKKQTKLAVRNMLDEDSTSQPATNTATNYAAPSSQQPASQPPSQAQMKEAFVEVPVSIDEGSVVDQSASSDASVARSGCRKLCCCCP